MLSFPAAIKVYLCTVPCDMRRSFDGLSMMAEHLIRCNPFSGHLLVFCTTVARTFGAIDPAGETVDTYSTEEAAKQDIVRCKKKTTCLRQGFAAPQTRRDRHQHSHGAIRSQPRGVSLLDSRGV